MVIGIALPMTPAGVLETFRTLSLFCHQKYSQSQLELHSLFRLNFENNHSMTRFVAQVAFGGLDR